MSQSDTPQPKRPIKPPYHPLLVLAVAVILPGMGQVMNDQPARGLLFAFTTVVLGFVTLQFAPPEASLIGRYAGGVFIYAISVMDAHRWARTRWNIFHRPPGEA